MKKTELKFILEYSNIKQKIFIILGVISCLLTLSFGLTLFYNFFFERKEYLNVKRFYNYIKNKQNWMKEICRYSNNYFSISLNEKYYLFWSISGDWSIYSNRVGPIVVSGL